jgi:phospholipid transport system substrate-binding protein
MLLRRGLLLCLLAELAIVASLPGAVLPKAALAAGLRPAAEPIATLHTGLLAVMKAASAGTAFPDRYATLAPVIERVFDLSDILRACVGPRWSSLSTADRNSLEAAFRQFTAATWVGQFDNFQGERFEILPDARKTGQDELVATRIVAPDGQTSRVDYVMRRQGSVWKAVDVLLNGTISRIAVQRSEFRALLAAGGARALIGSLRQKIAEVSGGTLSP